MFGQYRIEHRDTLWALPVLLFTGRAEFLTKAFPTSNIATRRYYPHNILTYFRYGHIIFFLFFCKIQVLICSSPCNNRTTRFERSAVRESFLPFYGAIRYENFICYGYDISAYLVKISIIQRSQNTRNEVRFAELPKGVVRLLHGLLQMQSM